MFRKLNQSCYVTILKTLLTEPSTDQYKLHDLTGLRVETVRDLLKAYHKAGCLHIVGWLPNGRNIDTTPIYALGPGEDVPKKRKPEAQVRADYQAKKKAERQDSREIRKKVEADPLLAAMHNIVKTEITQ